MSGQKATGSEGKTKAERMAAGSVFTFVSMVVIQLAAIANSIVIIRALGLFNVGIYSIITLTISAVSLVATFGIPASLVKFLAEVPLDRSEEASRLLRAGVVMTTWATCISTVALIILSPLFAILFNQPQIPTLLLIASVGMVLNALLTPMLAMFQAYELIRERGIRNMIAGTLSVPVTVALVLIWGLPGAVAAAAVNGVVTMLVNLTLLRTVWAGRKLTWGIPPDHRARGKLLGYAVPALLGGLLVTPVLWFTNTFLATQASFGEVGRYSIGQGLASYLLFIPTAIGVPLIPIVSRLDRSNSTEFSPFLMRTLRVGAFLLIPAALILIGFPEPLLALFYGAGSATAAPIVRIVAPAVFLAGVSSIVGSGIAGKGRMWEGLILNLYWAVVLFVGSLILIPSAAGVGLAFAYLMAYIAHFVGVMAYIRYSWRLSLRPLALPLLVAFTSFAAMQATGTLLMSPWRAPVAIAIIVAATLVEVTTMSQRELEVMVEPLRKFLLWFHPSQ